MGSSCVVSVHNNGAHSVRSVSSRLLFKMAFAGRTLNILGRSATRIRSTGVQRLRAEFAEGPGNVSF